MGWEVKEREVETYPAAGMVLAVLSLTVTCGRE